MLPDHLGPGVRLVFCGTAAGRVSAARGHYYAGPGNRFWGLLAETGLTPHRLRPVDDHLVPGFGLGLTDLAKGVAGMDKDIPAASYAPARLQALLVQWRPRAVAFTSLAAARLALGRRDIAAGMQADPWAGVAVWALQSPSRANGHFTAASWHALAAWVRERA